MTAFPQFEAYLISEKTGFFAKIMLPSEYTQEGVALLGIWLCLMLCFPAVSFLGFFLFPHRVTCAAAEVMAV